MAACAHCLLPLPAGSGITEEDGGSGAVFCCLGCRTVYRLLRDKGLTDFYRRRIGWTPGPPEFGETDAKAFGPAITTVDGRHEATLAVSGIRCAACIWLIERYVGGRKGVSLARVSYATGRASFRWDPAAAGIEDIVGWVRELGYTPHPWESSAGEERLRAEKRDLLLRFGTAAFLSMQVMTFTFALYAGYFQGIEKTYATAFKVLALALTTPVIFYSGAPFLKGTLAGLKRLAPGMDVLIFLGSFSAYAYSIAALAAGGEVYFDTAGMIVTLILLGRYLEAAARCRAAESLGRLVRLAPPTARKVSEAASPGAAPPTETVPVPSLAAGDIVIVGPGETVPADGQVVDGASETNESLLTGESEPVPKRPGDEVYTGTMNGHGSLHVRVGKTGGDTVLSRIVRAVEEAQSRKPPIQRFADRTVGRFVPAVLMIATLTLCARLFLGDSAYGAVMTAVSVLVVACPCALGLATPLAVSVSCAAAREAGVMVRGGDVLEAGAKVREVFLDKTGTLTEGRPRLTDVHGFGVPPGEVLRLAASLEAPSEHPIAKAVTASVPGVPLREVVGFRAHPGLGVEGTVEGRRLFLGRAEFLAGNGVAATDGQAVACRVLSEDRKTAVFLADGDGVLGILASVDALRGEAAETVRTLAEEGYAVRLLTGDSGTVASRIAREAGIGEAFSRIGPEEKADMVRRTRERGRGVLMVGDGINDAPALAAADVGIAMGKGTDIAVGSAGAVLTVGDLRLVPRFLALSRRTMRVIRQNLAWAFSYNIVAIPLAIAGKLHPVAAAGLMAASSLVVVGNSLRLGKG